MARCRVGHPAVGPNFSISFSRRPGEQVPIKERVAIFKERLCTLIATLGNLVLGGGGGRSEIERSDLASGMSVAIVGRQNGTSLVKTSDSTEPVSVGFLASHNGVSEPCIDSIRSIV